MRKDQIRIGDVYFAKVSGWLSPVRIESVDLYGGWMARNLNSNKRVHIKTAARLQHRVQDHLANELRGEHPPEVIDTVVDGLTKDLK